ncbi:MAG: mannitol dehydrogenase family protein [Pseudomonadota bacterium]
MATRLSLANLGSLPENVARPIYSRDRLSCGIVHFGVGNFHRAHQAVYLDALFAKGRDHDWAIVGTGVMSGDAKACEILAGQDYLTTVVEQDATHSTARVTGAMIAMIKPRDTAAQLARLVDPATRIVSLTITEGGYLVDPATGTFDPTHPAVVADAAAPDRPKTIFGLISSALRQRRKTGIAPFTVMSCDNVPHNGVVARNAVAGLTRLFDPELAEWITAEVAFPNSMVDRITPATSERERRLLTENFGVEDNWPVFCEPFSQWVLEDQFPAGRPALETVGVEFVRDVGPYETMKIRILNGGHAIIAYPAGLLGIHFVHDAMAEPIIAAFLDKVTRDEIIPILPPVPNTNHDDYHGLIRRRFANPKIGDTITRLCLDGSSRQPKFIVPTIADRLDRGMPVDGLALESALWCRYCYGETEAGEVIAPNDPNWDRLQSVARMAKDNASAWLGMTDIYGALGQQPVFAAAFSHAITALWRDGVFTSLRRYVDSA